MPDQPLMHVQVSGAEHSIFVGHEELQIAKLMYHIYLIIIIIIVMFGKSIRNNLRGQLGKGP